MKFQDFFVQSNVHYILTGEGGHPLMQALFFSFLFSLFLWALVCLILYWALNKNIFLSYFLSLLVPIVTACYSTSLLFSWSEDMLSPRSSRLWPDWAREVVIVTGEAKKMSDGRYKVCMEKAGVFLSGGDLKGRDLSALSAGEGISLMEGRYEGSRRMEMKCLAMKKFDEAEIKAFRRGAYYSNGVGLAAKIKDFQMRIKRQG